MVKQCMEPALHGHSGSHLAPCGILRQSPDLAAHSCCLIRIRPERVRVGRDKVRGRLFSATGLQLGNLEGPRCERFAVRLLWLPLPMRDGLHRLQPAPPLEAPIRKLQKQHLPRSAAACTAVGGCNLGAIVAAFCQGGC